MGEVERIARALAKSDGFDPDQLVTRYIPMAAHPHMPVGLLYTPADGYTPGPQPAWKMYVAYAEVAWGEVKDEVRHG